MKVMGFNGSPRKKKWNTIIALFKALGHQVQRPNSSNFMI